MENLTKEELQYIINCLAKQPFGEVYKIIAKLTAEQLKKEDNG